MMHIQFLRIKKLTGKNIIILAAKHNHREMFAEIGGDGKINPARVGDNYLLRGEPTAAGVAGTASNLLSEAALSRPLRKDAVRALEIIFGVPPDSTINQRRYFEDSIQWAEKYFKVPVLSAVVHLDEAAPHCHMLMLPLVNGRMVGAGLMGNRASLQTMQANFHDQVGRRYGLRRQTAPRRLSAALKRQAASLALETLGANLSRLNEPSVKQALADAISHNPEPLLMALGLNMPAPKPAKLPSFVEIMTRPCKLEKKEKPIDFAYKKPIGFDVAANCETKQSLSCVDFAFSTPPIPTPEASTTGDTSTHYTREPDTDNHPGYWDSDRGEFVRYPAKARSSPPAIESARAAIASKKDRR